jgi:dephospho-CoA kinase
MSPDRETTAGRIGIAGYMGSGKSTCAGLMAGLMAGLTAGRNTRVSVIDADREAKLMMNNDKSIRRQLAAAFGPSVADENSVDFGRLGRAAFASVQALRLLNGIAHPPLVKRLEKLVSASTLPCILDAALIPMWGIEAWFDRCLWVTASPQRRMERALRKTSISPEQIRLRMSLQEALLTEPAGPEWTIVENEGSLDELRTRIAGLRIPPGDIRT